MIYTKMTKLAMKLCFQAHKDQQDKTGLPYVFHPFHLAEQMQDEDSAVLALLHDVVEDSDWTFEQLAAEGFSPCVIEALRCVTKLSPDEPYDKFIARIKHNPLAVAVKLNDLTDNMDIRRLPYLSDKDVKRLKKYLKAYKQLTGTPTYSVYACRQEFPNAFDPWSEEDDAVLTAMWREGATIDELAAYFQRKPGGIKSRIKKLELEKTYGARE